MKIAIIKNGKVDNICEGDEGFAGLVGGVISDTAKIGDLYNGATFTTPAPVLMPPSPNGELFVQDVKTNIGGILVANALMVAYPAFFPAIQAQAWNDLQVIILDALSKGVINQTQYGVIKNSAATYSIPITLP